MALTFEKHILKMFDGDKKQNTYYHRNAGEKYLNKDIIFLSKVKVSPKDLKKGLINAFLTHKEYMNKDIYINETYFYEKITDMLICLHKEEDVVSYYMSVIDAFYELNRKDPEIYILDCFYFSFLYTLNKFEKFSDLEKVLDYYSRNEGEKKGELNHTGCVLVEWMQYYHLAHINKRFSKKFVDREIRYSLINMLDLLNRTPPVKQKIYSSINWWNEISKEQIEDILKFKEEFNHYPSKEISIKNIDKEVLIHFLGKENILLLRKNSFTNCSLNKDLNKFIKTNYTKEEIIDIFIDRVLANGNDKLLKYDRKMFDDAFYIYFNESHVNKLVNFVSKDKTRAWNNSFFKKIGCHKDYENSENLIRSFIGNEQAKEEIKLLNLKINREDVENLKVKKRL